ncbi:MAG: DUF3667 domain-containing protein [Bacteroidota bacterium]
MTCINCETEVSGNFCSHCGQRGLVKRLTIREGWSDFWSRVYGFDGMFPRTVRDLTMRPGQAAREYIAGNRVKYYGPVGYFFFMISLTLLVFSLVGIDFVELMQNSTGSLQHAPAAGSGQAELTRIFMQQVSDNMRIFSFLIIPVMAFWCRVFFRTSGYNLLEHAILPFYINGHIYILTMIMGLLYQFGHVAYHQNFALIASFSYQILAFVDFYNHQSRLKVFLKSVVVFVLAYVTFTLLMMLAFVIYVLLNPAALELLRSK